MTTRLINNHTNNPQHKLCNPKNKREQFTPYLSHFTAHSSPTHDQKQKLCYSKYNREQHTLYLPNITEQNPPTNYKKWSNILSISPILPRIAHQHIAIRPLNHKWMSFATWANAQVAKLIHLSIGDLRSPVQKNEKATSTNPCIRQRFVLSPTRCYHESSK